MAIILDGTAVAKKILQEIGAEIALLEMPPRLAIVFVGNDPASEIYIKNKLATAKNIGIGIELVKLSADAPLEVVLQKIQALNADKSINGIIVQAPLPDRSMQNIVFNSIASEKDVDGFSDCSIAKLVRGSGDGFIPCTPLGIYTLLRAYGISFSGKHVAIIGRGNIVGRPLSLLLSQKSADLNATVTLCHSSTDNLKTITKLADIVVAAMGQKFFLKKDMLKPGVVAVDVGINREGSDDPSRKYKIFGDIDFGDVRDICQAITPVPGGVGPMTIAMLMRNTLAAAKMQMA
ncbi:MAG: bifunctional 5,10-methylenetetrahydrofolate dehydrogenase/5,10-methenyltetrahydrofolate cyclohydrolase [Puniceicoccales bacterium]|jgi:methylenetetrahydrofolate dehydrogenase (NADP+)/methenyltetrahydrofolate cyclohydrolase|nr:bifunctional 5,10-methylenetetrahydrofolate dehydrogenase/5,10-methenyltetrahydrofolate cyclohydrolase [Puniceicoccales bacterium]